MSEQENWVPIPEFPDYLVSDRGRVMNAVTDHIKAPSPNQQGIPSVNLIKDHQQNRRSVAVLVASAFLPEPPRPVFDTPINLDGDRMNNDVRNLAWRPRWFALKYHAQFKVPLPWGFTNRVSDLETGEIFEDVRACAKHYGLLEKEIIMSAHNNTPVTPTWQKFVLLDP